MKQLTALQQQGRRSNGFRGVSPPLDAAVDGGVKSPATIFWLVIHVLCCLISLVLGFRFSRLVFFIIVSSNSSPSMTVYTNFQTSPPSPVAISSPEINTSVARGVSRVMVGRHGILIRPWPHPDPVEMMKAHRIMEQIQMEQRSQYGIKNPRTVIAVTPTYVRTFQALHLTGVMHSLMNVPYDLIWIVVEAGGASNETASLISKSSLNIIHIGFEEKMPLLWEDRHKHESRMRLHALRIVREKRLDGIIVFADDSNMHSLEFFDEIQSIKWIGAVSLGILAFQGGSEGTELPKIQGDATEKNSEKKSQFPVQGPACNSSNHYSGWHTFNTEPFANRTARFVGDPGAVIPRKTEWANFVLNSRLVWNEVEDKPTWVKDWEEFTSNGENVESPIHLMKDTSVIEPLGSCGRKVSIWWLRVEARADSKFPARWLIDSPLSITVPAKRTPWPDTPRELPSSTEKVTISDETTKPVIIPEHPRRKRSSRGRKKHISAKHTGDN